MTYKKSFKDQALWSLLSLLLCIFASACSQSDHNSNLSRPQTEIEVNRKFHILNFNTQTKQPNWIIQKAGEENFKLKEMENPATYYPDLEIPIGVQSNVSDYQSSKYVMASLLFPISKIYATPAEMRHQYFFSVTTPQHAEFYHGYWQKLRQEVKKVKAKWDHDALVLSGPLFLPDGKETTYQVIGDNQIPVPTHFFQVIFPSMDEEKAKAYIVPNGNINLDIPLSSFEVSLIEFERRSGVLLPETIAKYFPPVSSGGIGP